VSSACEAYLFAQSIDATSYERQRARLREDLTLAQIDHHAEAIDELDVRGILAFRRTSSAAGLGPVGLGLSRLQAAIAAAARKESCPRARANGERTRA
jgi:hypothetical protein